MVNEVRLNNGRRRTPLRLVVVAHIHVTPINQSVFTFKPATVDGGVRVVLLGSETPKKLSPRYTERLNQITLKLDETNPILYAIS